MSNVNIARIYSFNMTLEETVYTYVAVQNGSKGLHIIVKKVNKLLVCPQVIIGYTCEIIIKTDYHMETQLYMSFRRHSLDLCCSVKCSSHLCTQS